MRSGYDGLRTVGTGIGYRDIQFSNTALVKYSTANQQTANQLVQQQHSTAATNGYSSTAQHLRVRRIYAPPPVDGSDGSVRSPDTVRAYADSPLRGRYGTVTVRYGTVGIRLQQLYTVGQLAGRYGTDSLYSIRLRTARTGYGRSAQHLQLTAAQMLQQQLQHGFIDIQIRYSTVITVQLGLRMPLYAMTDGFGCDSRYVQTDPRNSSDRQYAG